MRYAQYWLLSVAEFSIHLLLLSSLLPDSEELPSAVQEDWEVTYFPDGAEQAKSEILTVLVDHTDALLDRVARVFPGKLLTIQIHLT